MAERESNNLPDINEGQKIPTFLAGDNWFGIDIDNDLLDFGKAYRPPRYTMERKGIPFADVGELHIISGKPGNGKTGLISQLMATILCGQFGKTIKRKVQHKVKSEDGTIHEQDVDTVVLYIDTEQGEDDTIAIKNRVCSLAGMDYTKPSEKFFILRLRDTEEAADRWKKILKAIWKIRPTDIFLDGLLDIVKDYNDQVECQPVIRKCMMLATEYDASLWAVLHENPMSDKLVGTLGSITQRKVAEIFTVIKVKQSELDPSKRSSDLPDIYFRVKQNKARGRDVEDWLFRYETNAGGWGQPVELEYNGITVIDEKRKNELKECDALFKAYNWNSSGTTYTELERHIRSYGHITSNRRISELFNLAMENGIIYKNDKKKYHYNGLKQLPDDCAQDLPFGRPTNEGAPF